MEVVLSGLATLTHLHTKADTQVSVRGYLPATGTKTAPRMRGTPRPTGPGLVAVGGVGAD